MLCAGWMPSGTISLSAGMQTLAKSLVSLMVVPSSAHGHIFNLDS